MKPYLKEHTFFLPYFFRVPKKDKITQGVKRPAKKTKQMRKRPRLQQMLPQVVSGVTTGAPQQPTASQVFEKPVQDLGKKPEFRIAESIAFALEKQQDEGTCDVLRVRLGSYLPTCANILG